MTGVATLPPPDRHFRRLKAAPPRRVRLSLILAAILIASLLSGVTP